jgi:hypothetical protein
MEAGSRKKRQPTSRKPKPPKKPSKSVATAAPSHCAPARFPAYTTTGSCLTDAEKAAVAHAVVPHLASDKSVPWEKLMDAVHTLMGTRVGEEHRWLWSPVVMSSPTLRERLGNAFRPVHPASWLHNPQAWLSTIDIEQVMKQYEASNKDFKMVGVFPRDFASRAAWSGRCVSPPMCDLSVASLRADGKSQFGVVFNMDRHDQRGSHWTACYGCINPRMPKRYGIFYYDSVAHAPPPECKAFMQRIASEVASPRFVVARNRVRRQFANTEYGIYSILFIVACLTTRIPFDRVCSEVMKDDRATNKLRKVFFSAPNA